MFINTSERHQGRLTVPPFAPRLVSSDRTQSGAMAISQFTPECDLMARFFIILTAFVMLIISCCLLSELKKEEPLILVLGARDALLDITKAV